MGDDTLEACVSFVRARLDEEERAANDALTDRVCTWSEEDWGEIGEPSLTHVRMHDPHRVLTEVAAKRELLDLGSACLGEGGCEGSYSESIVLGLASIYADDPEYDPIWA